MPDSPWGPLASRYETEQPRKILALDGGGIRGALTLQILLEMETQLRNELGANEDFCLADYFDYIGGTSTGAIIAAGLALGKSVSELIKFYNEQGEAMFDSAFLLNKAKYLYDEGPLMELLIQTFGTVEVPDEHKTTPINIDLKSGKFKSILLVVTMNRTTDSPWPISNNPFAKYNDASRQDCNLRIPLYQLVRASTAAPVYFKPQELNWSPDELSKNFVHIDGGVTPYNNPAFLLYRMATQKPYQLNWPTGERKLLIVSVGTGAGPSEGVYKHSLDTVAKIPGHLMYTMQVDQDINCRTVGRCIYGAKIDNELGDMIPMDADGNILPLDSDAQRHFSYVRYNADLSRKGLDAMGFPNVNSEKISKLDSVNMLSSLIEIGEETGKDQVRVKEHFKHFLNV